MDYLGIWVNNQVVKPILSKVHSIKKINAPNKVRDILRFLGLVKYHRDMWCKREHTLAL